MTRPTPEQRADKVYRKFCEVRPENRWVMEHFHEWMKEEFELVQVEIDALRAELKECGRPLGAVAGTQQVDTGGSKPDRINFRYNEEDEILAKGQYAFGESWKFIAGLKYDNRILEKERDALKAENEKLKRTNRALKECLASVDDDFKAYNDREDKLKSRAAEGLRHIQYIQHVFKSYSEVGKDRIDIRKIHAPITCAAQALAQDDKDKA